jgi:hypothetical protein
VVSEKESENTTPANSSIVQLFALLPPPTEAGSAASLTAIFPVGGVQEDSFGAVLSVTPDTDKDVLVAGFVVADQELEG